MDDNTAAVGEQCGGQLRRRVGVRQTAPNGAPIARGRVADQRCRLGEQRIVLAHHIRALQTALAGHGTDRQDTIALFKVVQTLNTIEVHDVLGARQAQVHHGCQTLPPGHEFGCLAVCLQQGNHFINRGGGGVRERCRLHASSFFGSLQIKTAGLGWIEPRGQLSPRLVRILTIARDLLSV